VERDAERRRGRSDDNLRHVRADDERAWLDHQAAGVMLVDCLADEQDIYSNYLRHAGIDPVVACDVVSAFDTARGLLPAVVITDMSLEDGSGLELVRRLRADARTRDTWIIVVSSRAFPADHADAERVGCNVFLSKPCLPQDLVAEVRRALDRRQRPRE
jgi:CheY-like chemotaxis protein